MFSGEYNFDNLNFVLPVISCVVQGKLEPLNVRGTKLDGGRAGSAALCVFCVLFSKGGGFLDIGVTYIDEHSCVSFFPDMSL